MKRELQRIEFVDIIQPRWEHNSSCVKEGPNDRFQGFYVEKDFFQIEQKVKKSDELIIRDMIINNDEHAIKV